MENVYGTLKGFVDPIFVVFILLLISLFIFWKTSKKKTGPLILLLAIVIFYGASIFPVANYLCHYLEKDYIGKNAPAGENIDVIVVLGGGAYDINYINKTFLLPLTIGRLAVAVDYYHKKPAKYFVCSGKGPGKIPEAEMMAHLAASLGVPREKIKVDARSNNTWQNAAEVHKIFPREDIHIVLVTSASHMKRSEKEFKKYFKIVSLLPTDYLYCSPSGSPVVKYIPQSQSAHKTEFVLKEIVALIWYSIKNAVVTKD